MVNLEKKLNMCMLADFYGNLLTNKQKTIFSCYWEQDLSLFEIAVELGISRQAVRDSLVKAEGMLADAESKCGFIAKFNQTKADLQNVIEKLNLNNQTEKQIAEELKSIIKKL